MARELQLAGPTRLRVERTQLVIVRGKGERRNAEAVPLDMIHSVSFGFHMASFGYIMGAVLLLFAGIVAFWLAPYPFEPWIYAAAGLLLAGALVGVFFLQSGHALNISAGPRDVRFGAKKKQMGGVQGFARDLMASRVEFIEGVYGEEE